MNKKNSEIDENQHSLFDNLPVSVKSKKNNLAIVQNVVHKIAHEAPELENLSPEAIKRIADFVMVEKLKDDMNRRVKLEKIDYESEKAKWIARAGGNDSKETRRNYQRSIKFIENYCKREKIEVLDVTPMQADDFIEYLKAMPMERRYGSTDNQARYGGKTINTYLGNVSAFYTWMERRHKEIKNPIRGTRSRPKNVPAKPVIAPTPQECERMIKAAKYPLRAQIATLVVTGIRCGGLQPMTVSGNKLYTRSKGMDVSMILPDRARDEIKKAGLPLNKPFKDISTRDFQNHFNWLVQSLKKSNKLRVLYSPHDLRHAYAVKTYLETKDIYRVSKALSHASINTTQVYLRSLDLDV